MLADAHVASPRVDAELLAAFVLDVPRGRLLSAPDPTDQQVTGSAASSSVAGPRGSRCSI